MYLLIIYIFFFLISKAEGREKERLKEENRRSKKLESAFRNLLRAKELDHLVSWEDSVSKLEGDPAFDAITEESDRIRIFKVLKKFEFISHSN